MTDYDVVLLPSFTQVEDWRKRVAKDEKMGVFSQVVTTFNAWIADLWELHGDGRAVIDSLQRQTIMQAAFDAIANEQQAGSGDGEAGDPIAGDDAMAPGWSGADPEWTSTDVQEAASSQNDAAGADVGAGDGEAGDSLTVSPGVVKMAARCVRDASGLPEFERALDSLCAGEPVDGLVAREMAFLLGIVRYRQLIASADLIEVGQAAARLVQHAPVVFPRAMRVLADNAAPPDWRMRHFFDSIDNLQLDVVEAPGARGAGRPPAGVDVRFAFPSGRYAQPGLVADLVREALADWDVRQQAEPFFAVVAARDPLALYKQLESELAHLGVRGCVQAQVPFGATDFGKRFLALSRVVQGDVWAKEDLSDAVLPPFSGYDQAEALEIDAELRKNRLAQRDDCLARLRVNSDTFSQLEELAGDPEADILLGVFEQIAFTAKGRSDAWRIEQLGAAAALRSCTAAARSVGASMAACARVLENTLITVSYEGARDDAGQRGRVLVTSQAAAAQMGRGACHLVVLCDLTAADYPVADRDDAAATLFAKLGLVPVDTALARMRRTFFALQSLPSVRLVCARPLNDVDGGPTYPAAPLQELVDAFCPDKDARDGLDEVFGLPDEFRATMVQRGEELLFANARSAEGAAVQPEACCVPLPDEGDVAEADRALMALPRRDAEGRPIAGFCPSPSQVEAYLSCPYKWFVQNRVNVGCLDEQFDALSRGSFAHEVLQRFYRQFQDTGHPKVTEANLEQAKLLMRETADAVEAEHRQLEPGSGRYVAVNQMEQRELDACKSQLVSYLDFEAALLPGFHPAHLEYSIRLEDGVEYAGHTFIGTVDRIDVDDKGNAVVIDYKGGVNSSYEIAGKNADDPGRVQTRMYAQAVQRALGLRVVAALYVSYGKAAGCAGAYDGAVVEAAHLPAMKHDRCSCAIGGPAVGDGIDVDDYSKLAFQDMLDETERLVARAIDAMESGEVHPCPSSASACEYCPAETCSKRGA